MHRKRIETVPKAQTLDLLDKDFKSVILNRLQKLKEIMSKELKQCLTKHRIFIKG